MLLAKARVGLVSCEIELGKGVASAEGEALDAILDLYAVTTLHERRTWAKRADRDRRRCLLSVAVLVCVWATSMADVPTW